MDLRGGHGQRGKAYVQHTVSHAHLLPHRNDSALPPQAPHLSSGLPHGFAWARALDVAKKRGRQVFVDNIRDSLRRLHGYNQQGLAIHHPNFSHLGGLRFRAYSVPLGQMQGQTEGAQHQLPPKEHRQSCRRSLGVVCRRFGSLQCIRSLLVGRV